LYDTLSLNDVQHAPPVSVKLAQRPSTASE